MLEIPPLFVMLSESSLLKALLLGEVGVADDMFALRGPSVEFAAVMYFW